jgi:hypothetical protein
MRERQDYLPGGEQVQRGRQRNDAIPGGEIDGALPVGRSSA